MRPSHARLAAVKQMPVKPKIISVSARTSTACKTRQADTALPFAACPSFSLNYTSQKSGSVGSKIFNVYTGVPQANHEAQLYTDNRANLRIEGGNLLLQALNDPQQGFNYTSARIDTNGKEDFLYGKIVVRATLPTGVGTWPAIWLLPSQPKYASLSPVSDKSRYLNDGEIDIAESVGTQPHVVYGIAHSLAYPEDGVNRTYFNTITVPDNDVAFHDYEVDWTPTQLTLSVDGSPYFAYAKQPGADYRSWPYDQPFYLVLNVALGGSWGGQDTAQFPGDGVDSSSLPATMKIQSVNYYAYIGPR